MPRAGTAPGHPTPVPVAASSTGSPQTTAHSLEELALLSPDQKRGSGVVGHKPANQKPVVIPPAPWEGIGGGLRSLGEKLCFVGSKGSHLLGTSEVSGQFTPCSCAVLMCVCLCVCVPVCLSVHLSVLHVYVLHIYTKIFSFSSSLCPNTHHPSLFCFTPWEHF